MRRQRFAARDFKRYCKPMRREQFLAEMNKVVPWDQLCVDQFVPGTTVIALRDVGLVRPKWRKQHHETVKPDRIRVKKRVQNRFR